MIVLLTDDARIQQSSLGWLVLHRSNSAVLATCETREEAVTVREAYNDLARQLRRIDCRVK